MAALGVQVVENEPADNIDIHADEYNSIMETINVLKDRLSQVESILLFSELNHQ
jgi:hypothetical protein